jgi:hypothetical protein
MRHPIHTYNQTIIYMSVKELKIQLEEKNILIQELKESNKRLKKEVKMWRQHDKHNKEVSTKFINYSRNLLTPLFPKTMVEYVISSN